jgi:(1->4)-alpha-D-glucan 1-alpha-D-glucosylmutase
VRRALELRNAYPAVFRDGRYRPLPASGARADHVIAFTREHDDGIVAVVCGRLWTGLAGDAGRLPDATAWQDTRIDVGPAGVSGAEDVLTGRRARLRGGALVVAETLSRFPVALLVSTTD